MSKLMDRDRWSGREPHEVSAKDAVAGTISGASMLTTGQLESVKAESEKQAEIIAILVQLLVDANVLTLEQIKPMLAYGYSVEED